MPACRPAVCVLTSVHRANVPPRAVSTPQAQLQVREETAMLVSSVHERSRANRPAQDKANLPGYAKTGTKASEIAERIVTAAKCVNETEPCPPCAEAREPCYKSEKVSSRCARCVSKGWTKVKCSTGRKESLKVKANKNEATAGKGAKAVEKDEKVKVMVLERQKLG